MIARNTLVLLLLFLGIGAMFGGGVLIISPSGELFGMPLSMLQYSPFHNFLIPGLFLFGILGLIPIGISFALMKRPIAPFAERFNLFKDMYWGWTYCIYTGFALLIWIQMEMVFLRAVHWAHTLYVFVAILILFVALLPVVRRNYKI